MFQIEGNVTLELRLEGISNPVAIGLANEGISQ